MISKGILRTVIADQLKELDSLADSVPRTIFPAAVSYSGASALVVKGVRRCGKSTLLKQLIKAKFENDFFYFNFDDERIGEFRAEDFQQLMETLIEAFGEKKNIFLDEIQNIKGWELFANRILRQGYRVFLTGSNANLLSKELGTHLTGRHVDLELYPFSFAEFLKAKKAEIPKKGIYSTAQRALLSKSIQGIPLKKGGMPEVVVFSNEAILAAVLADIMRKDICERYGVRKPGELKAVLNFLIANSANPMTYRSITGNFGIQSANTVQKYIEYAEETCLVFTVRKFERKLKRFDKNPKKVYCIDNGIIVKNAPGMAEKKGALLENTVAVHLKRLGKEFYYFKGINSEADFVVPAEKRAIQVCYELNSENKERETRGLIEAMRETKAAAGLILTLEQEQELTIQNKKISVKPVWQWLLEEKAAG